MQEVTEARRSGDINKELKVIADTCKLIGNSAYGGIIMDKTLLLLDWGLTSL